MDFLIQIQSIRKELSIMYFKGSHVRSISQLRCISFPEDCFTLTNSVDPDEMPQYVAFYLFVKVPNLGFPVYCVQPDFTHIVYIIIFLATALDLFQPFFLHLMRSEMFKV